VADHHDGVYLADLADSTCHSGSRAWRRSHTRRRAQVVSGSARTGGVVPPGVQPARHGWVILGRGPAAISSAPPPQDAVEHGQGRRPARSRFKIVGAPAHAGEHVASCRGSD